MKALFAILRITLTVFAALFLAGGFGLISTDLGAGIFGIVSGFIMLALAWGKSVKKKLTQHNDHKPTVQIAPPVPPDPAPTPEPAVEPMPKEDTPIEQEKEPSTKDATTVDAPESPYVEKVYHVTGVKYYMDSLMRLAIENPDYECSKREIVDSFMYDENIYRYLFAPKTVELVPEPENPYDKNAIKVVVDGEQVGHIKAGSCAHLLKVIREGRIHKSSCTIGGGPLKRVVNDYDIEKDKDVYTLERETHPYSIVLRVLESPSK